MHPRILTWLLLAVLATCEEEGFSFHGFRGAGLTLNGSAAITPEEGLLRLTNPAHFQIGHAFYPAPFRLRSSRTGNLLSFSSVFVFAVVPENIELGGHGIAFVISPTKDFQGATGSQYLGLFNITNNGNPANRVLAVELDTLQNIEMDDIDDNHAGIDINSLKSNVSRTAGYFSDDAGGFRNMTLISGEPMQVWVEYDDSQMQLNVTLSPMGVAKPGRPLLSSSFNLSGLINERMYVGFSSSTGSLKTSHYILGWNFKLNGKAEAFNLSTLPSLPRRRSGRKPSAAAIWVPIIVPISAVAAAAGILFLMYRRIKFAELLDNWELELDSQRFSYRDLYRATRGFSERRLLGAGGFGRVYRGVIPASKLEVAVKRVAYDSKRGTREFISEIASIGQLRHRNLVQLLGYCRRKRELLLVYDFMPNGSLDRFLFDHNYPALSWVQRFHIIKDVASGLLYLHEEWERTIIHRDVKASNVLLDGELNGRLGDFGLARLYDHGDDPRTTHVVGTPGYLAPELLIRTGKATKASDVFSFGAFLLEVACGRRPLEARESGEDLVLVGWVLRNWRKGAILETLDARLGCYVVEEAELVLKLGLLCSHHSPVTRPSMRQVTQYLESAAELPELTAYFLDCDVVESLQKQIPHYCSMSSHSSSAESLLSGGPLTTFCIWASGCVPLMYFVMIVKFSNCFILRCFWIVLDRKVM